MFIKLMQCDHQRTAGHTKLYVDFLITDFAVISYSFLVACSGQGGLILSNIIVCFEVVIEVLKLNKAICAFVCIKKGCRKPLDQQELLICYKLINL